MKKTLVAAGAASYLLLFGCASKTQTAETNAGADASVCALAHEHPEHVHGENCGHKVVLHSGHQDYSHNGHVDCPHTGHYDIRLPASLD